MNTYPLLITLESLRLAFHETSDPARRARLARMAQRCRVALRVAA